MNPRRQSRKVSVGVGSIFNRLYVLWTPHILAGLGWETNHFHLLCRLQWVGSVPPTGVLLISGWNINSISRVFKGQGCVCVGVAVCTLVAISLVQDTDRNDNVWRILF